MRERDVGDGILLPPEIAVDSFVAKDAGDHHGHALGDAGAEHRQVHGLSDAHRLAESGLDLPRQCFVDNRHLGCPGVIVHREAAAGGQRDAHGVKVARIDALEADQEALAAPRQSQVLPARAFERNVSGHAGRLDPATCMDGSA